ncbi:MAG TPA: hypothetical protein VHC69_03320 [Polyangiaceae bacterium]|nr:hypothetical protein [Polyangiaceae bacterium]
MPYFSSRSIQRPSRGLLARTSSVSLFFILNTGVAFAQEANAAAPAATAPTVPAAPPEPAPPAGAAPPPPYSLPFQLRPAAAATAIRYDEAFGFYEDPGTHDSGFATVPILSFSYKVVKGFAPIVKLGVVSNSPPDTKNATTGKVGPQPSGFDFLNPIVGGTYALELSPELRLAFFLGFTIPVGGGGGNSPDPGDKAARGPAGIYTRNAMDNAMFAVDDFTFFPGVDFAFVKAGFTAQAEATLYQLTRVRGGGDPTEDASRTNLTMGLHAGYFVVPAISLGAEIRHQRWLSTPKSVTATPPSRDTTTIAVGPRFHLQVAKGKWLRPGVAFAFPVDEPMTKQSFKVVQLDIPFTF